MSYYAVRVGKIRGIYNNWKECEENIKGYSGAKYKKFEKKEEAEEYLKEELVKEKYPLEIKSQKELKEYVKNLLKKIGLCESVKSEYPEDYIFFMELY